MRRRSIMALV